MGTRYSDRFFAPRASDAELLTGPASGLRPDESSAADRVEAPVRPRPARRAYRVVALAAAAGLVLGAVVGAYGWEQRRDRQAVALARSTVDVRSQAAVFSTSDADADEMSMSVRTYNDGVYPVTLTGLTTMDGRLAPAVDGPFRAATIPPGESSVALLHYRVVCTGEALGSVADGSGLRARVRTVDGEDHDADVPVSAYGGSFDLYLSEWCAGAELPSFQEVALDVVRVEQVGDQAVYATVGLSYSDIGGGDIGGGDIGGGDIGGGDIGGGDIRGGDVRNEVQLEVLQVGSRSAAFLATWEGSVTEDRATGSAWVGITWSVRDCAQAIAADSADMALDVTGRLTSRNPAITAVLAPSADLAAELVRLTQRVCA